jgi:hypothetical protein
MEKIGKHFFGAEGINLVSDIEHEFFHFELRVFKKKD